MVAGYEILLRIGRAIFPSAVVRGFHPTSIVGPLGSAAAASHLLRLDACKTTHALALAASFSGGLMEAFGAYSTAMIQVGRAAHSGIMAALLAKREIISTDSMLEGGSFTQSGFLSAYTDNFNTEIITQDLGKMWTIRDVALKTYDGVAAVHTGVDAALEIIVKHNLNRDNIEAIDVRTHSRALSLQPSNVETGVQGKFSIPFIIAAYLKDGIISPLTFTDDKVRDKGIRELMGRINVSLSQEIENEFPAKWGAVVSVRTRTGNNLEHSMFYAKGEPENPLRHDEIEDKFRELSHDSLDPDDIEKIVEYISQLEGVKDITTISVLLP
jgi:2-methylcitrate dehydratase PrpD